MATSRTSDGSPLYRRLPHGPSGLARAEVRRNQRARVFGGMVESVARRGYRATTVADVIALAGVSRRTFYEQFANKQECFLATHDIVVAGARKRAIDAWGASRDSAEGLSAGLQNLLEWAAEPAPGARLMLVEVLAVGGAARERVQLASTAFERLVASAFEADGAALAGLAPRAVVGGVRHLALRRMLERRERELAGLAGEILDWADSYRSVSGSRLPALGPPVALAGVPAGRDALLPGSGRRSRALAAIIRLTGEGRYQRLTDGEIAGFAGLSTEAFHRQFATKEACMLAALAECARAAVVPARRSFERAGSWPQAVHRAIAAFLAHLVAHPDVLRLAFVDVFELGSASLERLARPVEELTDLLAEGSPVPSRGPAIAREAVTGALLAVISAYAPNRHLLGRAGLVEHLSFLVLAPHLGPRGAIEAIELGGEGRRRGP